MKKTLFHSLIFSALLFFAQTVALACNCPDDPETPIELQVKFGLAYATAVFTGEVIEIREDDRTHTATVKVMVKKSWKGVSSKEMIVTTEYPYGISCGYGFEIGESYLIFALASGNSVLKTGECTHTRRISQSAGRRQKV